LSSNSFCRMLVLSGNAGVLRIDEETEYLNKYRDAKLLRERRQAMEDTREKRKKMREEQEVREKEEEERRQKDEEEMREMEGRCTVDQPTSLPRRKRESALIRRRRAKIAEIRAKMREMKGEEKENGEEGENGVPVEGSKKKENEKEKKKKLERLLNFFGDAASAVSSGCKNSKGVFRQMNKKGKPIYEWVSGGNFGMRQINMKGKKAIFKPQKTAASSAANGIGKACLVAALALDAIEIGCAIREDYKAGTKHNTVHTVSGVAGGWAGAVPGAMGGAALGSVVPVAGSLVGGIIGGVVGSFGGGFFARKIAVTLMPAPEKNDEDTVEKVEESAQSEKLAINFELVPEYEVRGVEVGETTVIAGDEMAEEAVDLIDFEERTEKEEGEGINAVEKRIMINETQCGSVSQNEAEAARLINKLLLDYVNGGKLNARRFNGRGKRYSIKPRTRIVNIASESSISPVTSISDRIGIVEAGEKMERTEEPQLFGLSVL
ncbi:hypothetical protein PFISCL1PPCAC_705, partial [Pristionchus fissidentatus]